ncbi:MAG TPA: DUF2147 domain-containing protein [Rhizomicrobium sp.]|nr:DUF2147 domain-containing protein [Rhizomicrobium sp.]
MNIRVIGAIIALAALAFGPAEAAGANAVWLSNDGQARIKVEPCGANLCGTIVWLADPLDPSTGKPKLDKNNPDSSLRSRPVLGLQMLEAKPDHDGQWQGTIYNGKNGKTYAVTIHVEDAALKIEGCAMGGVFCRTQTWTRVSG